MKASSPYTHFNLTPAAEKLLAKGEKAHRSPAPSPSPLPANPPTVGVLPAPRTPGISPTVGACPTVGQTALTGQPHSPETAPLSQTVITAPGPRPLLPIKALAWALYRDESHIQNLIGDRKLVAFNLSSPSSSRNLIVIWTRSAVDYLANRPTSRPADDAVLADILPGTPSAFIPVRVTDLALLFTVTSDHVRHLIAERCLAIDTKRPVTFGRGQSPFILRDSLVRFLKNGRLS